MKFPVKFSQKVRNAVAKTSDGQPLLGVWLNRVQALDVPVLTEAIDGIWCGREGSVTLDLPGSGRVLAMGWYNGKVEWSYIS